MVAFTSHPLPHWTFVVINDLRVPCHFRVNPARQCRQPNGPEAQIAWHYQFSATMTTWHLIWPGKKQNAVHPLAVDLRFRLMRNVQQRRYKVGAQEVYLAPNAGLYHYGAVACVCSRAYWYIAKDLP